MDGNGGSRIGHRVDDFPLGTRGTCNGCSCKPRHIGPMLDSVSRRGPRFAQKSLLEALADTLRSELQSEIEQSPTALQEGSRGDHGHTYRFDQDEAGALEHSTKADRMVVIRSACVARDMAQKIRKVLLTFLALALCGACVAREMALAEALAWY